MNNTSTFIFAFSMGAAIGAVVTWKVLKTKYEQIAQEEIDSVKETFDMQIAADREVSDEPVEKIIEPDDKKINLRDYANRLAEMQYVDYANAEDLKKKEEVTAVVEPYVIPPEEFGEKEDYDTISLTYYADKVLTDDWDELVEDVDNVVGLDSLETFGEYEDDAVYVRNDELKADYEILLDTRKYIDVVGTKPHHAEEE